MHVPLKLHIYMLSAKYAVELFKKANVFSN